MTRRELVKQTLEFNNTNGRVPRQLWTLPWTDKNYPEMVNEINLKFPGDITTAPAVYSIKPKTIGSPFEVGDYVDEWGCKFVNIIDGIHGEVKEAIVQDEDWDDVDNVHIPEELLSFDVNVVNDFCAKNDKFIMAGVTPRPFEQLQFIRGTENLYMDLTYPPEKMLLFMEKMHNFYCRLLTKWAQTNVDVLVFMDDWGSQNNLLINPDLWVKYFKPMYKDYIDIGKKYGKKVFMHSDGYIVSIFPHLIEMGLDAINSQIFCMGVETLKQFKGKITFWGEIDRQHILPNGTTDDVDHAVESIYQNLWTNGGCIAQCEFGPGANPNNAYRVFDTWSKIASQR